MIQQIKHHSIITQTSFHIHTLHNPNSPIPIHFPKTPQFTNPFTPLKPTPIPQFPITQSHSSPTIPSISLTILETPILPYKSTLFQSTHITLPSPYYFLYIIYKIKPYSTP